MESEQLLSDNQQTLMPALVDKNDKAYNAVKDIAYRLQKKDAHNIALTGPYGSGKSSVLETLIKDFKYNYLRISLATLESYVPKNINSNPSAEELKTAEEANEKLNRLIEYSILQQLIYKEKSGTIPYSRFKRILHIAEKSVNRLSFLALGFIIAFFIAFEPGWGKVESLCRFFDWGDVADLIFDIISLGYMSYCLFFVIKHLIISLYNNRLNKLNLKDGEIEITEQTSIFNKHLDEILYFFEVTDYDVVIIEDLDRFGTSDIFLKLRELNQLLNESKAVDRLNNQPIVFVYAVKDDIFKDSSRSKFFDYITTVIPIINPSNSKDKLKEALVLRGIVDVSDEDLKELSFFINDMRLLINIANEFKQYRDKLSDQLIPANLLAMIIYKNYHPDDFSELHQCKGKVYEYIQKKKSFVMLLVLEVDKKVKSLKYLKDELAKNSLRNLRELRTLYVFEYLNRLQQGNNNIRVYDFKVNNKWVTVQDLINDELLFESIITSDIIYYRYSNYYSTNLENNINLKFESVERTVDPTQKYDLRKMACQSIEQDKIEQEIKELEQKKVECRSWTLKRLLDHIDLDSCEIYNALNLDPLIAVFIQRGYINEEYYDYISYFYPNMITEKDRAFLLSIKARKNLGYDYGLDKIKNVVGEIPNYVYRTNAIFNNRLLDYLAEHMQDYISQYNWILKQIIHANAFKFLSQYYVYGTQKEIVFFELFSRWADIWNNIVTLDEKEFNPIVEALLRYFPLEKSDYYTCNGNFKKWFIDNYSFLTHNIEAIGIMQMKSVLKKLDFKFNSINTESGELLEYIVGNKLFVLSSENLCTITNYYIKSNFVAPDNLNLTRIRNSNNAELIDYIEENLEYAIKSCFSKTIKDEDEDSILFILNSDVLEDIKQTYLNGQTIQLSSLEGIEGEFKALAMGLFLLQPTWENVVSYYDFLMKTFDQSLMNFISHFSKELGGIVFPEELKSNVSPMFTHLMGTNELPLEAYKNIVSSFNRVFTKYDLKELEPARMQFLVDKGKISFTEENTDMISINFSGTIYVDYLLSNKLKYLVQVDNVPYNTEIAAKLLQSNSLNIAEKSKIIMALPNDIINSNAQLANLICSQLENDQELTLEHSLLIDCLTYGTNLDSKVHAIKLALQKSESYNESMVDELLDLLPSPYKDIAIRGRRPLIPKNKVNMSLIGYLIHNNYISSSSVEDEGIRVNTKR